MWPLAGMKRPNYTNREDACCKCGALLPTPPDGEELTPPLGSLGVWHPDPNGPPQWICESCFKQLDADRRK